jgi:hypothetical protein
MPLIEHQQIEIRSTSDCRLLVKAFRENWAMSPERRASVVRELRGVVADATCAARMVRAAKDALVAAGEVVE